MENTNQTVSVILPVYNAEKYLSTTIESVLNQTYSNIELIAVNDCSTDSSIDILSEYQHIDSRIKVINLKVNSGVAVARNIALENSKGKYIAFIDSDDIWRSDKIQIQIDDLVNNNGSFSYTGIEIINEKGVIIKKKRKVKRFVTYKYLLKNTVIATSSVLIDNSKIKDIRMPNLRSGQDYATWLKILRNDIIAIGLDLPLVQYRISPKSLSSNKFKSIKQVWSIQRDYENIIFIKRLINLVAFIFYAVKKKIL